MNAIVSKYLLLFLSLFPALLFGYFNISANQINTPRNAGQNKASLLKSQNFAGSHIPVLCYHAIREVRKGDGTNQRTYSVSPANFAAQIKALANNGYKTITPDELRDFYLTHRSLPQKPIIITFDDGSKAQYDTASRILDKYNFKGVFFIMTVTIGKPNYMNQKEIKDLADNGHIIGCHTWDHHKITDYKKEDWALQLLKPKKLLEKITEKPVTSFAYPYGIWSRAAADSVKSIGFTTAFIVYGKQDPSLPLYTIQRIAVKNSSQINDFIATIKKGY